MGFFKGIELLGKMGNRDNLSLVCDYFDKNVERKLKEVLENKEVTIEMIISPTSLDELSMINNYIPSSEISLDGNDFLMIPDSSTRTDLNDFSRYDGKIDIYKTKKRPIRHFCLLKKEKKKWWKMADKYFIMEPPHKIGHCGSPYWRFDNSWYLNRTHTKIFNEYLEDSDKITGQKV